MGALPYAGSASTPNKTAQPRLTALRQRRKSTASASLHTQVAELLDRTIKNDEQTVGELIGSIVGVLGENIQVRRFAKFALGEG